MSKTLAVFGATGQQGSSVVDHVLNDPELFQTYKVRAITRNVNSEKLQRFKGKIEVVQGDADDRASLEKALNGVHTVYIMTMPSFTPNGVEVEFASGKTIADVAIEQGVKYIIFSTLPSVTEISGGKYTKVVHFDAKAKIEQYIRSLPVQSAFVAPAFFMENFSAIEFLSPRRASDGTWIMARHNSPQALMPMINATGDTGKFVGAILAEPDKYEGKTFCAATALYTMEEAAAIMSKVTGQTVVYKQISLEEWKNSLPFGADIMAEGFSYPEEFGMYGPDTKELVAWAAENAHGKVTTLEEYLTAHPIPVV